MDVIKLADYIIDIGPEGGKGGKVVAKELQEIADNKNIQILKKLSNGFNYRKQKLFIFQLNFEIIQKKLLMQ
jgi:hypothetical protein